LPQYLLAHYKQFNDTIRDNNIRGFRIRNLVQNLSTRTAALFQYKAGRQDCVGANTSQWSVDMAKRKTYQMVNPKDKDEYIQFKTPLPIQV
jgi:hypothetical protein